MTPTKRQPTGKRAKYARQQTPDADDEEDDRKEVAKYPATPSLSAAAKGTLMQFLNGKPQWLNSAKHEAEVLLE